MQVPLSRPWLDDREAEATRRVLASGWITQGPEVLAFEREFAEAVGSPHACAVSSGTTALHVALLTAGVGRCSGGGDEVITVSHSFIATADAIRHCGATPVFVDIDPATCNMDPGRIEAAITPRTRAILCVHQMGMPCDLARIVPIARASGLALIEDAACAAGSEILRNGRWERIGRPHSDAACFSFHPRKVLTTGDGGMITTPHADWDRHFRKLRHHGMNIQAHDRHVANQVIFESYELAGYNYRMTDLQAAVGREQLRKLDAIVERRRLFAARYDKLLAGLVATPEEPEWAHSNWQSYCIRIGDRNQRDVMQALLDRGIATRRGIMCAHREPAYPEGTWRSTGLRHSECATDHSILLPLFPTMTEAEQDAVAGALRAVLS
jgi:dTDP-4-amino-4,6-dideoxygalactose transaminase